MRLHNAILLSGPLSLASALTVYSGRIGIGGPPRQHQFNESNLNDLQNPNTTNSVNFAIGGEEWTWRVNVTSFSVPDAMPSLDEPNERLPDPRIVLSTFDLQWPRTNESLNDTAIRFNERGGGSAQSPHMTQSSSNSSDPICMSVLTSPIWPNVTNKVQDQGSGDCEAALGQDCVRAILMERTTNSEGDCTNPSISSPACQGALGIVPRTQVATSISGGFWRDRDNFTTYYSDPNSPQWNMSYHQQTYGGDGIFYQHGIVSPEANETALRQAESQFRMMVLTLPSGSRSAVCMRVNTSIDDEEVSDIAQRAGWGKGQSGDDSSAATPQHAATMGFVALGALAVVAFGLL